MAEKAKRIKLKHRTLDNDIKFKGIFSYRELRIIGWACLIIAQLAVVFNLNMKINPASSAALSGWVSFFQFMSNFSLPLFLIANMAAILQKKNNFRNMFLFYGGVAAGMFLLGNVVVFHYGFRFMNAISPCTWGTAADIFGTLLPLLGKSGYIFNIFIDLFLCSLMFFFMNYNPKKYFQGKKIIWFRLFTIFPILYEVGSVIVKFYITFGYFTIPSYVFFLLTSKPPFMLLAFFLLVLVLKTGEIVHKKKYKKSNEEFNNHLETNAHSFLTSIHLSIIFLAVALLDVLVALLITYIYGYNIFPEGGMDFYLWVASQLQTIGIGGSTSLIPLIPIVLLFSYKKTPKNKKIDTFIPVVGVALIVFVLLEGIFEVITINLPAILQRIEDWINSHFGGGGDEPEPEPLRYIVSLIRSLK